MPENPYKHEIAYLNARIIELLGERLRLARAPMSTCNRINDELEALRVTRARLVGANDAN